MTYLKDQSGTLRQLLNFDEDTDVAPQGVSRKLQLSTVRIEGEVNDIHITTEKVKKDLRITKHASAQLEDTLYSIFSGKQECVRVPSKDSILTTLIKKVKLFRSVIDQNRALLSKTRNGVLVTFT